MNKFEQLGLNESLLLAIKDLGFENPSEVQEKAIPVLLEQDTDLVALAQTGTGKTAAFGFPLIQKIDAEDRSTQALILSPTRELCLQITNEIKQYSKYVKGLHTVAVYGGASITEQAREIKRGAQVIVATPGRMQDMINRGLVNIKNISYCILDEADEMLNMGFYDDIVSILSDTPDEKKTWLFSATMPAEVARIAKKFMADPVEITVGHKNSGSATVSHEFYCVNARDRYEALKRLADANPDIFSVVFCRTKRDTQAVAEKLIEQTGVIGEKIEINSFEKLNGAFIGSYVHSGKIAVLVALSANVAGADEAAQNVAMQAAALSPIALDEAGVDADTVAKEIEIAKDILRQEGKPEAMIENIAKGKLGRFFKDNTLVNQDYIKDNSMSVANYIKSVDAGLTVTGFKRVALG